MHMEKNDGEESGRHLFKELFFNVSIGYDTLLDFKERLSLVLL